MPVDTDGIPDGLKMVKAWVAWKEVPRGGTGKPAKMPISPRTGRPVRRHDAASLVGFDDAVSYYRNRGLSGIGFVFLADDRFAGVDLDRCRDRQTGELDPLAADMLAELDTYAEVSPSRTGVKAIARGKLPPGRNRTEGIELYDRGRFFAITGHRLPDAPPTVEDRADVLARLHARLFPPAPARPATVTTGDGFDGADLLARAFRAKNGHTIRRYWSGDMNGKPSASEALLGLAQLLAFWTGPDADRLESLLTGSPLWASAESERVKWSADRNGQSWGLRYVVRKAIDTCRAFYSKPLPASLSPAPGYPPIPPQNKTCVRHSSQNAPNPIGIALRKVEAGEVPEGTDALTGKSTKVTNALRRLAGVCWQLAGKISGGRFPLSIECAARAFGVGKSTLARWVLDLEARGLIRRIEWGNSLSGRASVWEWAGTVPDAAGDAWEPPTVSTDATDFNPGAFDE